MAYTPTTWQDGVTAVNAARMNNVENELVALDANPVVPAPLQGKWLKGGAGGAMVWALLVAADIPDISGTYQAKTEKGVVSGYASLDSSGKVPLAQMPSGVGGGVDYKGPWSNTFAYQGGDVITYNGVTYQAVNPGTGQTPPAMSAPPGVMGAIPLVTALPASPFEGQEVIFTDSLTAPTYSWRLRYVGAKTSNKWVFVGGVPATSFVATSENTPGTTYGNLTTIGPQITVPVAGVYNIEIGAQLGTGASAAVKGWMSYDIGATGAVDADATAAFVTNNSQAGASLHKLAQKTLAAATALVAKYRHDTGGMPVSNRYMAVTPAAVGG